MNLIGKYKNGNYNVRIYSDGTKVRETEDDAFLPMFAENQDIKICSYCDAACPMCHEGSTVHGGFGDILNEKFIDTLHPYQEAAIGGGNPLSHPDLIPFLHKLKERKVIANMTVNQKHFMAQQDLIRELVDKELVYGLGVSLVDPTPEFIDLVSQYPNAVIHVINGIFSPEDVEALSNKGLKILILGYKKLRRGEDYYAADHDNILFRRGWLCSILPSIFDKFKVISFDNLAIEQLDVRRFFTQEEWDEFFMGQDSEYTFYIDMVERKFAKSSTAPMNERFVLLDNVDDMFEKIRAK